MEPFFRLTQCFNELEDRTIQPSGLTSKQAKEWRRATRLHNYNQQLRTSLSPLVKKPWEYQIIFVDYRTYDYQLQQLLQASSTASSFTIDTEGILIFNKNTHKHDTSPALIQTEIIISPKFSFLGLFECYYLPREDSPKFAIIKSIWQNILNDKSKIIRGWGNSMIELSTYLKYKMFTEAQLHRPSENTQNEYLSFSNPSVPPQGRDSQTDSQQHDILEIHAPPQIEFDKVSLQTAVSTSLSLFLDKSLTRSKWAAELERRLQTYVNDNLHGDELDDNNIQRRRHMVLYSINDCFAVTHLSSIISNTSLPSTAPLTSSSIIVPQSYSVIPVDQELIPITSDPATTSPSFTVILPSTPPSSSIIDHQTPTSPQPLFTVVLPSNYIEPLQPSTSSTIVHPTNSSKYNQNKKRNIRR
ncbi:unnamed protein product [Didymodactylos carnosus]|uniref:Uncharacterized protein n=1 Tax=Didymodactylos carnosus TaxID=1234261 RepID=A0A814IMB8_9BILA|nr:unnamed protein product [Didymodactylos carnosus]CAF1487751.1 unnamed protein product [Didymodactylos carnosus]CAF3796661.1 unnamed protein product [Didymodactylos carnosus]CAF4277408.1 unnamed protein product [Didymodactylos carnosus]